MGGGAAGLVLGLIAVVFLQHAAAQTVHVVGESTGWSVPTGDAAFYSKWAATKTFVVGDTLRFNFQGAHDVLELDTQQLFDACTFNSTDDDIQRISPVTVRLDDPGMHYFVCTISSHCSQGQKFSINVISATARGPTMPSPPSPSSSNAVMASLYVTLLSAIVMSLFSK